MSNDIKQTAMKVAALTFPATAIQENNICSLNTVVSQISNWHFTKKNAFY